MLPHTSHELGLYKQLIPLPYYYYFTPAIRYICHQRSLPLRQCMQSAFHLVLLPAVSLGIYIICYPSLPLLFPHASHELYHISISLSVFVYVFTHAAHNSAQSHYFFSTTFSVLRVVQQNMCNIRQNNLLTPHIYIYIHKFHFDKIIIL